MTWLLIGAAGFLCASLGFVGGLLCGLSAGPVFEHDEQADIEPPRYVRGLHGERYPRRLWVQR